MKSNVIIKMGASRWDVIVRGADGKQVVFDLYGMSKDRRREFHHEFMKAYRASCLEV
jgi:hypothetical protein